MQSACHLLCGSLCHEHVLKGLGWLDLCLQNVVQANTCMARPLGTRCAIQEPFNSTDKTQFREELKQLILQHKAFPSVIAYAIFNEAWGQFDTMENVKCAPFPGPVPGSVQHSGNFVCAGCIIPVLQSAVDILLESCHVHLPIHGIVPVQDVDVAMY